MATTHANFMVSEDDVLRIAVRYDKPIIIDFDETLYLQNSTEDFIDCAIPGVLALIVLKFLDIFAPWRWTGGKNTRDIWRVRLVLTLFPRTLSRWKRRCREQKNALTNMPLLRTFRERDAPFVIATSGFSVVVNPLLSEMGCADVQLIACRLNHMADRKAGKLALIEQRIGAAALAEAMVVTDSIDDVEVLRRCACPCLTQWKNARFQRSFRRVYLPGMYEITVKRPGRQGIGGLITSFSFWLLASMTGSEFELSSVIVIFVLFLSLWSVYEVGYMDNDICAQKFEADPVVSDETRDFPYTSVKRSAWISAVILGIIGCILAKSYVSVWNLFVKWALILAFTRYVYYYYNRIDKKARIWLYLILQLCREASFMVVVPVGVMGAIACTAHIIGRWQKYFIYRYTSNWPEIQFHTVRLFLFILLSGALFISEQPVNLWAWPTAAILAWCAFLARNEIVSILKETHRIDTKATGP